MASKPPPSDRLAAWIAGQRWFGAKGRRIVALELDDAIELGGATLWVVRVALDDGTSPHYAVPLAAGAEPVDALDDASVVRRLFGLVRDGARVAGRAGGVTGHRTRAFAGDGAAEPSVRRLGGEQSNTSIVLGETLVMKHFRRLAPGVNPDLEITRFLSEVAGFPHTPALAGWLEYVAAECAPATLAVVQGFVAGARDGWEWMLAALRDERGRGETLPALRRLGEITAALHLALAGAPAADPALAPAAITDDDLARWSSAVSQQLGDAAAAADGTPRASDVAAGVAAALAPLRGRVKCRHHGDYHLGQTLYRDAGRAFTIIDFEGEPLRPLDERRRLHSPLRDVAGMLRSIAYAAETVRAERPSPWIAAWETSARAAFTDGYLGAAGRAPFLPEGAAAVERTIAAFEIEKAAYEVVYEANNRPGWIGIPLGGLVRAAAALRPPRASGAA